MLEKANPDMRVPNEVIAAQDRELGPPDLSPYERQVNQSKETLDHLKNAIANSNRTRELLGQRGDADAPTRLAPPRPAAPAKAPVEREPKWLRAYKWQLDRLQQGGRTLSPSVRQEVERQAKLRYPEQPRIDVVSKDGMNILLVGGQYKAAMPVQKGKGVAGLDSIRIPGTNKVQPVQVGVDGTMTPLGSPQEMSSGDIDREFKVDILGPNAYTMNKESAKELRKLVSDSGLAAKAIDKLLAISNLQDEEYDIEKWGEAGNISSVLRGRMRIALVGGGNVSEKEWSILEATIPDPTKIAQWDKKEQASLTTLKTMLMEILRRDAEAHIEGGLKNVTFPSWHPYANVQTDQREGNTRMEFDIGGQRTR